MLPTNRPLRTKGAAIKSPPPARSDDPRSADPDWTAAQAAIRALASKWTIPIVVALASGPLRYTDLHRAIGPAVSQKVLAETLRHLERENLITRLDRPDDTPRAAFAARSTYELTESARALQGPLAALGEWQRSQARTS